MTSPLSSSMMTGPEATAAEQSRMELQAKLNGLGGLNGRQLDPAAREKKLREACEGFESIFIQKMWQEMRKAVPQTGILTGREERFWQDMYDQELSKSMTTAGGIGLADMMYEQLSRNLVSASRSAAGMAQAGAFVPQAAPLVAQDMPDQIAPPAPAAVYESEAPQMGDVAAEAPAPAVSPTPTASPAVAVAVAPQTPEALSRPLEAPRATPASAAAIYSAAANTSHASTPRQHAADLGQASGMINAQKAMREAGDKLGSRAVRPAQNRAPRNAAPKPAEAVAQEPVFTQAGGLAPGSPEALKAAMELSRSGDASLDAEGLSMAALVANVQAKNAAAGQMAQNAAQEPAQPAVRKVRRTTNIPQRAAAKAAAPKQNDAIRTLNVDNVGVNSKAGQGLKAYHAQKEAMAGAQAMAESASQQPAESAAALVPPLTAPAGQAAANSAIPPLTARTELRPEDANNAIPPLTAPARS